MIKNLIYFLISTSIAPFSPAVSQISVSTYLQCNVSGEFVSRNITDKLLPASVTTEIFYPNNELLIFVRGRSDYTISASSLDRKSQTSILSNDVEYKIIQTSPGSRGRIKVQLQEYQLTDCLEY